MAGTRGKVHIDRPMSNFSVAYKNGSLIADIVSPRIGVENGSDEYFIYGRRNFRADGNDVRANGGAARQVDSWSVTTGNYRTLMHALKDNVTPEEYENADAPIKPEMDTVEGLTDLIMLNREKRVADLYTTAATWSNSTTLSGTDQWDNASLAAGSIEEDLDTGKEAVRQEIGVVPNTLIIPQAVANVVKRNSDIRDLIKYTQSKTLMNGDLPPTMFNLRVLIPGGVYDSANEGQTFSAGDVWGKHVVLCYLAPNPRTIKTPTAGLSMQSTPRRVRRWLDEETECNWFEVSEKLVEKVVAAGAGYVIRDAIS